MSVTRRTMLAAGGAIAAASVASAEAQAQSAGAKKRTFVLVHGGGHGGWCWKRVADPLKALGHDVYAPSLSGMADRSHQLNPGINLDTQITDIVNLLKWEDLKNVILVGHSYGGMVITGVADRALDRIGHMVYYDAAHPKNGTPLWPRPAAGATGGNPNAASKVVNGVELILFPTEQFVKSALLAGWDNQADIKWVLDHLTPHPAECFFQPLKLENEAAVHKLPTTDIWRKSIGQNQKQGVSTWAQRIELIDTQSHNLMVSHPKESVEMLLKIAAM